MNYQLAYAIGFHPWEDAAADPPFVAKAAQMFDREEEGRQPPLLGCALLCIVGATGAFGQLIEYSYLALH